MLKFEYFKSWCYKTNILDICKKLFEQAGAELGQAQLKLGLDFI